MFLHRYSMDRQAYHCSAMSELMDVCFKELSRKQLLTMNRGSFISGNVSKNYLEKSGNVYIARNI